MEKWFIKNKKADFKEIGRQFGISDIVARLLVNRDISTNEQFEEYLHPSMENMHNPLKMKDLEKTCTILLDKIVQGKSIRIIGDYDVDGVMSTYILYTALKQCGAKVDYEIPDRIQDGYGINVNIINNAFQDHIDTIITCDNGIAAVEQISHGKQLGMTILITDHHDIPYRGEGEEKEYIIPEADSVVNPKQDDCTYPFKHICGAMVVYKLVQVLYHKYEERKLHTPLSGQYNKETRDMNGSKGFVDSGLAHSFLEFAAIATVCDVMDLVDENRIVVKKGLEVIQSTPNIGLKALIMETGLSDKTISVYHLGFVLGPCINASGRLESAKLGLKLLLSTEEGEATALAKKLKELNEERKNMTAKGLTQAVNLVETTGLLEDKILVVYLEDCHESLAGIIAGRLKEQYYKPAIVLTKGKKGVKGSGRSIEAYSMFDELSKCKDILDKFGGHPMAAGLSLQEEKIEEFRRRLNNQSVLTEQDLMPKVTFDMVLPLPIVSISLIREIGTLEPFGKGNTKPSFARKNISVIKAVVLGANKNVLRLTVKDPEGSQLYTAMIFHNIDGFLEAIVNKYGEQGLNAVLTGKGKDIYMDIIFYPDRNEYNGYENIQVMIQHYR